MINKLKKQNHNLTLNNINLKKDLKKMGEDYKNGKIN
jgi:hypothetical protein